MHNTVVQQARQYTILYSVQYSRPGSTQYCSTAGPVVHTQNKRYRMRPIRFTCSSTAFSNNYFQYAIWFSPFVKENVTSEFINTVDVRVQYFSGIFGTLRLLQQLRDYFAFSRHYSNNLQNRNRQGTIAATALLCTKYFSKHCHQLKKNLNLDSNSKFYCYSKTGTHFS